MLAFRSLLTLLAWHGVNSQLIDCGITGCYPGQVLNTVNEKRIFDALGSVVGKGFQSKKVAVGIGNVAGTKLVRPRWYTHSGMITTAAPYELATRKSLLLLFSKTSWGIYSTEGVLSYDIEGSDLKLAIMWSVANKEDALNVYNVKVYPQSTPVDKALYTQMSTVAGPWRAERVNVTAPDMQEKIEYGIKLRAHMTGHDKAQLTFTVDSKQLNSTMGPLRMTTCEKKSFSGNLCRRECTVLGQCWTSQRCDSADDCASLMNDCEC